MKNFVRAGALGIVLMQLVGLGPAPALRSFAVLAALTLLLAGFGFQTRSFKIATAVFSILGALLLLSSRASLEAWAEALVSMTNVVAILAVMQAFALPIRQGGYDSSIRDWVERRLAGKGALFAFATFLTNLLTSFLNLGSVPVLVALLGPAVERRSKEPKRFLAAALSRGYVLTALWSPGAVNLALVVQATGITWSEAFLPGLLLALLGMFLSVGLEGLWRKGLARDGSEPLPLTSLSEVGRHEGDPGYGEEGPSRAAQASRAGRPSSPAWHLGLVALAFILLTLFQDSLALGGSATGRMLRSGALVALAWILVLARRPGWKEAFTGYWREGLPKAAEVGPFFVALGLFSTALEASPVMEAVRPALEAGAAGLGALSIPLAALLIIAGSLVGLHPFMTIVIGGAILVHSGLALPRLTIALGLSVGGAAAYMLTPFAGVVMSLATLIGVKPVEVALRWNWRFAALFLPAGIGFSFLYGWLAGGLPG